MRQKPLPVLALSLPGIVTAAAQSPAQPPFDPKSLIGSWEGRDAKGITGSFQFQSGGYVALTLDGQNVGGPNPNGPSLKYEMDPTQKPMWLDLVGYDAQGIERLRMKCILHIVGPRQIRISIGNDPSTRPTQFDKEDSSNTLTLKKAD